jgi:DNA-directed RNA polymerase sigma subunit (sigma70/sigma32)
LDERERRRTLKEIGDSCGVSKERVRQLQSSALKKIREALNEDPILQ